MTSTISPVRGLTPDWNNSPPFITSTVGGGDYYVTVKVHSIEELHAAYDLVLKAFSYAAAPDLLAALDEIVDALESGYVPEGDGEILKAARAALSKAEQPR